MKANKLKAGGYCRVSTKGQVNKISLADQKKQIEDYCKRENLALTHTYIEKGVSGRTVDRPEFRKMLGDAANKEFQVLVVADNDRFGRNANDRLRIREMFTNDFGIELHSVKDGVYKDDATGKFQDTLKASVSEYFRDLQVEKSASALSYKLSTRGERNLGHLLYGLQWNSDKQDAKEHPQEAKLLRAIIDLRISKRWSYTTIANYLNKKKHCYRNKKKWDYHKVSYICSLNAKKYCSGKSSVTFQGEKFDYSFPQLISKIELAQLKDITPDYIVDGRPRKTYLLSGKLTCGLCQGSLQHNVIANKYNGKRRVYQYYVCKNKLESPNGERCQLPYIPQEWLEWWVWQRLTSLFKNQEHFEQVILKSTVEAKVARLRFGKIHGELDELREKQKDCSAEIQHIMEFARMDELPPEYAKGHTLTVHKRKAKMLRKQTNLKLELALIENRIRHLDKLPETRLWWLEYSGKLKDKDKRKLVDALIERIEVSPRKYTKAQAERDDKHGGGPESGLEAKISIEVVGILPLYRSSQDGKCLSAGE